MKNNSAFNIDVIKKIASALNELNEQVVYVGGAVLSLYVNDPAADDVRPTKDVDISLSVASLGELEEIREKLVAKGFIQTSEDDVICRFRYEEVKVDVMNTKSIGWAPSNPWFEAGFAQRQLVELFPKRIAILPLPYFLAAKFSAYNSRGRNNPVTSHDFEDIVYILDNSLDIQNELSKLPEDVKPYLKYEFKKILNDKAKQEAIEGNVALDNRNYRVKRILDSVQKLFNGD
jgi:predicted nucleotidyltransferase